MPSKLETRYPADLARLLYFRIMRPPRRTEVQHQVDHSAAVLVRAVKVLGGERGVAEHGESFDFGDEGAREAEFVDELEDHLGVLVGFGVAGEDARDEGEFVFCEADFDWGYGGSG